MEFNSLSASCFACDVNSYQNLDNEMSSIYLLDYTSTSSAEAAG